MMIELLSVELLQKYRQYVERFQYLSQKLNKGLGWHYLLDLSWSANYLNPQSGMCILDAGAGLGVMQWWLAGQGVDVISVDKGSRYHLPDRFRKQYRVQGWRTEDLAPIVRGRDFLPPRSPLRWHLYPKRLVNTFKRLRRTTGFRKPNGTLYIYNQDLSKMPDIADNSIDAIVAISALEHNTPDGLRGVVNELMRVLKPGGILVATLHAAKEQDWLHESSQGWCYTEETLRDIFDLPDDCPSNYDQYDELLERLKHCTELRDNLADFYFETGDNGMPWGKWNPQYQPVGVVKVKHGE